MVPNGVTAVLPCEVKRCFTITHATNEYIIAAVYVSLAQENGLGNYCKLNTVENTPFPIKTPLGISVAMAKVSLP